MWQVIMHGALHRLKGVGKSKSRPVDRPPLADVPTAISENDFERSLGPRSMWQLKSTGHTVSGVRAVRVFLGEILKAQERVTRRSISQSLGGVTNGGLLISEEIVAKYREDASRKRDEGRRKIERADARAGKRAANEVFTDQ